jgi:hypothetical protein
MNTSYCNQTKQLYHADGSVVTANEKGISTITVDGIEKRYILKTLLEYIERHGALPGNKKLKLRPMVNPVVLKKVKLPEPKKEEPAVKEDLRKTNTRPSVMMAVFDAQGNQVGIYESVKLTSDATGVSKASISKCANGKAKWNVKGLIFQKVPNQQTA